MEYNLFVSFVYVVKIKHGWANIKFSIISAKGCNTDWFIEDIFEYTPVSEFDEVVVFESFCFSSTLQLLCEEGILYFVNILRRGEV